jgi:hypothetical protein
MGKDPGIIEVALKMGGFKKGSISEDLCFSNCFAALVWLFAYLHFE